MQGTRSVKSRPLSAWLSQCEGHEREWIIALFSGVYIAGGRLIPLALQTWRIISDEDHILVSLKIMEEITATERKFAAQHTMWKMLASRKKHHETKTFYNPDETTVWICGKAPRATRPGFDPETPRLQGMCTHHSSKAILDNVYNPYASTRSRNNINAMWTYSKNKYQKERGYSHLCEHGLWLWLLSWHCPGGTKVNTECALTKRLWALNITLSGVSGSIHLITKGLLQCSRSSYVCVKGWIIWDHREIPTGFIK